ncbi:peptidoglycan DD-metalloendopeptidase family protein [Aquirufa sp. ROCK2-A2]
MFKPIFSEDFTSENSVQLDLSKNNPNLKTDIFQDVELFSTYINQLIGPNWGIGGYLEHRKIYEAHSNFATQQSDFRNIHLGIDIWAAAGTPVLAPQDGVVHALQINEGLGNYGPTIILRHEFGGQTLYSLYGHLSHKDLEPLKIGQYIRQGDVFCHLGHSSENGSWPPHLHVQCIRDLQHFVGDYPGVCLERDQAFYAQNCPDPRVLWERKYI